MGEEYLNEARRDLHKTLTYCIGKTNNNAYILRMKALYTSALLEISYGCDVRRVKLLFDQLMEIINKFNIHRLKREFPDIADIKFSSKEYLE